MNSNGLVKMGSRSIVYVGIYALIYLHTILGERIVSRDGLPRGVLPSGILKIEKYCPGLKVRSPARNGILVMMNGQVAIRHKNCPFVCPDRMRCTISNVGI